MKNKKVSPKINSIEWGKITVSDGSTYKDAKLFPGGARTWDWTETGTHHIPGIQPADLQELLDKGAEAVVLSKGFNERLQVSDDTIEFLAQKKIPYFILQTEEAIKKYSHLRTDIPVGALIHSTC